MLQQPTSQGWTPKAPGVLALAVLLVYSITFAAVPSDGFLMTKGSPTATVSLYNDQLKTLVDSLGFLPHLRATQAFAAISLVVFAASFISCIVDYKADAVTMRSAVLLFCTSAFLTLTWVLEVTLYTRKGDWDTKLQDELDLDWGFAVVVGASVVTAVLGGVSACYSMSPAASYVPQGQMMQSAVPMHQSYVPPQMQPVGMQPAMVPAYQPAGQQQVMQQPMAMQQPVQTMQPMVMQQQQPMAMQQQQQQQQPMDMNVNDASLAE